MKRYMTIPCWITQEIPRKTRNPCSFTEKATISKKLYKEEAIMELELSDKPFVLYRNARRDVLQIVYRRPDGDYSIIELGSSL